MCFWKLKYIWADKSASRTSRGAALALAKAFKDKERPDSTVINIGKNLFIYSYYYFILTKWIIRGQWRWYRILEIVGRKGEIDSTGCWRGWEWYHKQRSYLFIQVILFLPSSFILFYF